GRSRPRSVDGELGLAARPPLRRRKRMSDARNPNQAPAPHNLYLQYSLTVICAPPPPVARGCRLDDGLAPARQAPLGKPPARAPPPPRPAGPAKPAGGLRRG